VKRLSTSVRSEGYEPHKASDASTAARSFVSGIGRVERAIVLVVKSNPIVSYFDARDLAKPWRYFTEKIPVLTQDRYFYAAILFVRVLNGLKRVHNCFVQRWQRLFYWGGVFFTRPSTSVLILRILHLAESSYEAAIRSTVRLSQNSSEIESGRREHILLLLRVALR